MNRMISLVLAALASLAIVACSTCTPYAPDEGLFLNAGPQATYNRVTTAPVTLGPYTISLNTQRQVEVHDAGGTVVAQVAVPAGMDAYYTFYGTGNRFLMLDLHTTPPVPPAGTDTFQQVVVDLTAHQPQGHALTPSNFFAQMPQLHIYPSPGNGLAFLVWYGLGGGQIQNAAIYRSDTGALLCATPNFTAGVQVIAKVTPTSVQILDGGTVKQDCPVPAGSLDITPASQTFGPIAADATQVQSFTFKNSGTDCCLVTAVSSSAHFSVVNPSPSNSLNAGQSQAVSIQFNPHGDVGTFNEVLHVTRDPSRGADHIAVTGISTSPVPHLTVTKRLRPTSDPGRFALQIDGVTVAAAARVGDGGSTGAQEVTPGLHRVSELGVGGTDLSRYASVIGGDCAPDGSVTVAAGDNKVCTITNVGAPRLTVSAVVRPSGDPGAFDLLVDGVTRASTVGDGGGTGPLTLAPGAHVVGETAATGTILSSYTVSMGGDCASNGSVTLAAGDDKRCTVTNTAWFEDAAVAVSNYPGSLPTGATGTACVDARNTGTTTWTPGNNILKLWQDRSVSLPRNVVDLSGAVSPGQTVHLCFDVKCNAYGAGSFGAQMSGMRAGQFGQSTGGNITCR